MALKLGIRDKYEDGTSLEIPSDCSPDWDNITEEKEPFNKGEFQQRVKKAVDNLIETEMCHYERRRLFKLQQALGSFYIGVASAPRFGGKISRWDRHKNKYDAMFVIATITTQSTSTSKGDDDIRRELEEFVIDQYKDTDARCDNKNKGGGGNDSKEPIQILYVCIKLNPIHDHIVKEYHSKLKGKKISYHIAVMNLIKKIDEIRSPEDKRKLKSFSIGFIHTDELKSEMSEMKSTATSLVQIYKLFEITNRCLPEVPEGAKVDPSKLKEEYALTLVHSLTTHYRFSDHSCPEFEYRNELIEEYNPGEHKCVIFLYTRGEIKNPQTPTSHLDRSVRGASAPANLGRRARRSTDPVPPMQSLEEKDDDTDTAE